MGRSDSSLHCSKCCFGRAEELGCLKMIDWAIHKSKIITTTIVYTHSVVYATGIQWSMSMALCASYDDDWQSKAMFDLESRS